MKVSSTTECVSACGATEYSDWTDTDNLKCLLCSSSITDCSTCIVQSNTVVCTACVSSKYLKSTNDECKATCREMSEYKYDKHDNNATNLYKCVS